MQTAENVAKGMLEATHLSGGWWLWLSERNSGISLWATDAIAGVQIHVDALNEEKYFDLLEEVYNDLDFKDGQKSRSQSLGVAMLLATNFEAMPWRHTCTYRSIMKQHCCCLVFLKWSDCISIKSSSRSSGGQQQMLQELLNKAFLTKSTEWIPWICHKKSNSTLFSTYVVASLITDSRAHTTTVTLVQPHPQATPVFSMLHAKKWEGLVSKVTCMT